MIVNTECFPISLDTNIRESSINGLKKVSSTLSAALWEGFLVGERCRMSQVGHTRLSKQSPSRGLNGRHWPADTPDLEQYTEVNDEVH